MSWRTIELGVIEWKRMYALCRSYGEFFFKKVSVRHRFLSFFLQIMILQSFLGILSISFNWKSVSHIIKKIIETIIWLHCNTYVLSKLWSDTMRVVLGYQALKPCITCCVSNLGHGSQVVQVWSKSIFFTQLTLLGFKRFISKASDKRLNSYQMSSQAPK